MCGKSFGTPRGSQTWDGAIPTHGNGRYGYYKNLVFRSKIEKCKQFSPATGFWTSVGFHPPGQPSRQDETTPRGGFVNFTLRGLFWHLEYAITVAKWHNIDDPYRNIHPPPTPPHAPPTAWGGVVWDGYCDRGRQCYAILQMLWHRQHACNSLVPIWYQSSTGLVPIRYQSVINLVSVRDQSKLNDVKVR
jgi:hypothetical protein